MITSIALLVIWGVLYYHSIINIYTFLLLIPFIYLFVKSEQTLLESKPAHPEEEKTDTGSDSREEKASIPLQESSENRKNNLLSHRLTPIYTSGKRISDPHFSSEASNHPGS